MSFFSFILMDISNHPDSVWKRSSEICMKLTSAECTLKNSWWWAEKMPETCRVSWQNKIVIISASGWLFKKKSPQVLCYWELHRIKIPSDLKLSLNMWYQRLCPYKTTAQITIMRVLSFTIFSWGISIVFSVINKTYTNFQPNSNFII
jgi:hypothetical protein